MWRENETNVSFSIKKILNRDNVPMGVFDWIRKVKAAIQDDLKKECYSPSDWGHEELRRYSAHC